MDDRLDGRPADPSAPPQATAEPDAEHASDSASDAGLIAGGGMHLQADASLAVPGVAPAVGDVNSDGTPDIVDIDTSVEADATRFIIEVDRQRAALLGVPQQRIAGILQMALNGEDVTYVHQARERYPIPVRLDLPVSSKADLDALLALEVRSQGGQRVPISEIANVREVGWDDAVYHKDLLPVVFVTADMAGSSCDRLKRTIGTPAARQRFDRSEDMATEAVMIPST